MSTKIEWAQDHWEPVGGCTRVSEGCRHCYAEMLIGTRLANNKTTSGRYLPLVQTKAGGQPRPRWSGELAFWPERLDEPLRRRKPTRYFVCSQSDLFHESRPIEHIAAVFAVMATCPQHTFLVLTKRPARAAAVFAEWAAWNGPENTDQGCWDMAATVLNESLRNRVDAKWSMATPWPLPNVWLGVSAENEETADERIPVLLSLPAARRFVSYEPALSAVDMDQYTQPWATCDECGWSGPQWQARAESQGRHPDPLGVLVCPACSGVAMRERGASLDWIIAGCESGPGARPAPLEWVRSVRDQVLAARGGRETPLPGDPHLFVKQWDVCDLPGFWRGGRHRRVDSSEACGQCGGSGQTGKIRKGCPALDGRVWAEIPGVA